MSEDKKLRVDTHLDFQAKTAKVLAGLDNELTQAVVVNNPEAIASITITQLIVRLAAAGDKVNEEARHVIQLLVTGLSLSADGAATYTAFMKNKAAVARAGGKPPTISELVGATDAFEESQVHAANCSNTANLLLKEYGDTVREYALICDTLLSTLADVKSKLDTGELKRSQS